MVDVTENKKNPPMYALIRIQCSISDNLRQDNTRKLTIVLGLDEGEGGGAIAQSSALILFS